MSSIYLSVVVPYRAIQSPKCILFFDSIMPISLRIPIQIETQIADYSSRCGISKSAVIVRSIEEFLSKHAQPSAYQVYLDVMKAADKEPVKQKRAPEQRGHKLAVQKALRRKNAERSARAQSALKSPARSPRGKAA